MNGYDLASVSLQPPGEGLPVLELTAARLVTAVLCRTRTRSAQARSFDGKQIGSWRSLVAFLPMSRQSAC
jgi:hypothetical protein